MGEWRCPGIIVQHLEDTKHRTGTIFFMDATNDVKIAKGKRKKYEDSRQL